MAMSQADGGKASRVAITALFLAVAGTGAVLARPAVTKGDGSSCGISAVRVEAKSAIAGAQAQRAWIAQRHSGSRPIEGAITQEGAAIYDQIKVRLATGDIVSVCFDITDYFGRY